MSAAALLALCVISPPTQAQTGAEEAAPSHKQVIVVTKPAKKSGVQTLPPRFIHETKKHALAMTGSEVWSVPKAHASFLIKRLEERGYKVVNLENDWNHILMQHKVPGSLGPAQQAVVNKAIGLAETVNVNVLRMPNVAVIEHAMTYPEGKIVLPLAQGNNITLVRTQTTVKTQKGLSWRGLVERSGAKAGLMALNDGRLSGYFAHNARLFSVTNIGGDIHTLAEMDAAKLPPDHPPTPQSKSADSSPLDPSATVQPVSPELEISPFSHAQRKTLEGKKITIEVMNRSTKCAASRYTRNPADILALAIEEANESFRNSGLGNITLRLVHSQAIDYDGRGDDHFTHLYRMVDGVGPLKEVKRLRNEKRADIVGLVIDNPHGCGLSTRVGPDSEDAFFVV